MKHHRVYKASAQQTKQVRHFTPPLPKKNAAQVQNCAQVRINAVLRFSLNPPPPPSNRIPANHFLGGHSQIERISDSGSPHSDLVIHLPPSRIPNQSSFVSTLSISFTPRGPQVPTIPSAPGRACVVVTRPLTLENVAAQGWSLDGLDGRKKGDL